MPITSHPYTDEARSKYVPLRVSPSEYGALTEAARARGLSLADVARERLFSPLWNRDETEASSSQRNPFLRLVEAPVVTFEEGPQG